MVIRQQNPHRFQKTKRLTDVIVGIKGAGEMASAVAWSLHKSNIRRIFMMEIAFPLAVRRAVCFCEAIHTGRCTIEGVEAVKPLEVGRISAAWDSGAIAVIQDPKWDAVSRLQPDVVIDATLAKRNLGTARGEAPLVIGLGPGFEAGNDVHLVVETHRGHDLGRIIDRGPAQPNTGVPGNIGGYTSERVLRAPCDGLFQTQLEIGAEVRESQPIGRVGEQAVTATLSGVLRGMIHPDTRVTEGVKIGDIDPRGNVHYCYTISEKARAIGGSVVQAVLSRLNISGGRNYGLAEVISLSARGVVSLIGAGGKTSLMFKLAKELAGAGRSVLTTTTTRIFFPDKRQSPHTVVAASWDRLLGELEAAAEETLHVSAGESHEREKGKLIGLAPETVDRIWQTGLFDVIIVEADGAGRRPLKASADHEPVFPRSTSHLVHVTGLDAIGQPVERAVHRPEIFIKNLEIEPGTVLRESHLAESILREVQKGDKQSRPLVITAILNKADTLLLEDQGKRIAGRIQDHPLVHNLAVLALNSEHPVKFFSRLT